MGVNYEEIGRIAARQLVTDWNSTKNGCTDRWLQDQLILFMSLAKGRSKMATCSLELHTKTAIYIAELLTGVKFDVSTNKDGTVYIECDGIGYRSGIDIDAEDELEIDKKDEQQNDDNNDSNKQTDKYLTNRPSLF